VPSLGRRPLLLTLACLALGLLAYELVPRDETRIASLLERLCTQLNQTRDLASLARLRAALPSALEPQVALRLVELELELEGLPSVQARAADLLSGAPLTVALSSVETHLSGNHARVDADLLVTLSGSGEQRRDLRRTRVFLRKHGASWQIERLEVDPVAPSEPEARP
jgi:hypothetical protein